MKERRPERNKASTMTRGSGGKDFQLFSGTKKARRKRTRNTWVPWFASWVTIHWFSLHYGLAFTINFKMDYPTIYKLLLKFSSEEFLMIERDYFFFPNFQDWSLCRTQKFSKKTEFSLEVFIQCIFTFIVLVCHIGFTSLFFPGQFLQASKVIPRWFSFLDMLPANIYRNNIF